MIPAILKIFTLLVLTPRRWRGVPVVGVAAGTSFRHQGPAARSVIFEVIEELGE